MPTIFVLAEALEDRISLLALRPSIRHKKSKKIMASPGGASGEGFLARSGEFWFVAAKRQHAPHDVPVSLAVVDNQYGNSLGFGAVLYSRRFSLAESGAGGGLLPQRLRPGSGLTFILHYPQAGEKVFRIAGSITSGM
jgi:hypothetical protein